MSSLPWSRGLRSAGLAAAVTALAAAIVLAARSPLERTLFKDLPATDPVREVVQAVLDLPLDRLRRGLTEREWAAKGFDSAWRRARSYFPGRTYLVRPGTYFMTHGLEPDGRLFIEVHDSDYLALAAEALHAFTPGAVVENYADARAAGNPLAAAFGDKMGRLELFFRDKDSQDRLRRALGGPLHGRLLEELREENFHMLAGGLLHEGAHAGVDDATAARVQSEFRSGERAVQWDELGAFMTEAAYHARFCGWAANEIAGAARSIEASLRELEPLRRAPSLRPGRDQTRLERARDRTWTFAALAHLRMRESWQSALRVKSLVDHFRRDYIRGEAPDDIAGLLASLDHDAAVFVEAQGRAVQAAEYALLSLDATLELWTEWAEGRRPFPPPITDSIRVVTGFSAVAWPDPPAADALALMDLARAALGTAPRP
jgi:hypothetical protein